jgi:hypothetical protein
MNLLLTIQLEHGAEVERLVDHIRDIKGVKALDWGASLEERLTKFKKQAAAIVRDLDGITD